MIEDETVRVEGEEIQEKQPEFKVYKKQGVKKGRTPSSLTKGIKERGKREKALPKDYVWDIPGKKRKTKNELIEVSEHYSKGNSSDSDEPLKTVTKSQHWKCLNTDEKVIIRSFFEVARKSTLAWDDKETKFHIEGKVVEDLLFGEQLDGRVVDWYGVRLQEKEGPNPKCIYFSSTVCAAYDNGWTKMLENVLVKRMNEVTENTKFLYFPINTSKNNKPHHWTLLLLDLDRQVWTHFDSIEHKRNTETESWIHATKLMSYVTSAYYESIKNNPRPGVPTNFLSQLEEGVSQYQPENSVDCALYTCLNMELEPTFDDYSLCALFAKKTRRMRADIAVQMLSDISRSWKK